ncbi:VOC family protein [Pseudoroseicyclus tamaricis]|uniref:VOC family protein n=1 Tax=Pseudoroseicyclus tamaricis TaxID=2705421 RepID=A0A6B2JG75_9RHOB|nr:VOC family protein [Pseudoroseicyclus tamaricis]NDV00123.1 VOC family protein [Pseudoroseicyclus tamaricis]
MLTKHKITNIFYWVTDLDRTEAFWRDAVGLDVQRVGEGEESFLTAPTAGGVDLLFFPGEVKAGNCPMIVFDLPEGGIDAMVDALLAKGAALMTPVSHAPGGWSAELTDPDGHVLSLYQEDTQPR